MTKIQALSDFMKQALLDNTQAFQALMKNKYKGERQGFKIGWL